MRIDFVITELFVGGAERCLCEVALSLHHRGDRVRVFSLGSLPQNEQGQLVDRLTSAGIPVESAGCDSPWQIVSAYRFLRKKFRDNRPDVVQTFLHHANIVGVHAARSAGVKTRVAGIRVAQNHRYRNILEKRSLRHVNHTLCVSQAVETFTHRVLGCDPSKTSVIPNGVDLERFANAKPIKWSELGWPEDAQVSLFVGRLDHQKGTHLLEEQIETLAPPDSNQKLLIIGNGPLQPNISQWVTHIGKHRAQLLRWQADIAPWVKSCDLMILPSLYEGMPNVLLEAMACGKPVVCSLVEGSLELLGDSSHLQGFGAGRGGEMSEKVRYLMENAEIRDQVGKANLKRISSEYSLPSVMERYHGFYHSLTGFNRQK